MKELKNLKRVVCMELEKLDAAYANKDEFSEADAKKYDMLAHAWKSHLTAEAMEAAGDPEGMYGESSYARGRGMNGRYISRDMEPGYSDHYPYPPRMYSGWYDRRAPW